MKTPRRLNDQSNSLLVVVIALYSASADDTKTVFCFLQRLDIRPEPRKIQKPVRDFLESWQEPQSASVNLEV